MTLPKPLDMSDTEILDFIHKEGFFAGHGEKLDVSWGFTTNNDITCIAWSLRQAVCQAAAILKENENG